VVSIEDDLITYLAHAISICISDIASKPNIRCLTKSRLIKIDRLKYIMNWSPSFITLSV
jgi:hypothetical protein